VLAPAGLRLADLDEVAVGGVVDLVCRVLDVEALVKELFELSADSVAVVTLVDKHVRREGREAARRECT
jgi:hypothetical protein